MSYSNYSTYLKYKNCCRPIGDTGPPGPAGPTGPAATIDIPGNKGEILYFSQTDNLISTDNVFIQEGNITINNNLIVTGTSYLNNTLDVSGSTTIQNGVLRVLNPNDKISSQFQTSQGTIFIGASNSTRFGDVSYNLIFSTGTSNRNGLAIGTFSNTEPLILGVDNREVIRITDNGEQRVGIKTSNPSATLEVSGNVIFNGNLSMSDQFINDVSGIYFSDTTYIGHGSSFDITTPERLDIGAAGGVTITGNLIIDSATTVNKTLNVVGNTTLENLLVNGSINNLIEISGNTIQPIVNEYVNLGYDEPGSSNDKRFNLGFFNKIKTRTAVIVGNLTMDDSFINDVSGIYFSDGTYIGHGSSFDITTPQTLDISAVGGVTIRSTLDVSGNLSMNKNSIKDVDAIYFSENGTSNEIFIDYAFNEFTMKSQGSLRFKSEDIPNATVTSEIDIAILNNNNLRFNNDNTYITSNSADDKLRLYGNSIFMQSSVNGDFNFVGNSTNVDLNFLTTSFPSKGYVINYNDNDDKIKFNNNDFVIDKGNNYIGIQTDTPSATLEVNGNAIISGNLSMNNQFINDVSGIIFTQGNLLFSDFSSVNQSVQLPSSQGQPISLERKTLFYAPNFNSNIPGTSSFIIDFTGSTIFNQLKLNVNGNVISPTPDTSGQYVEIYANFDVSSNTSPAKTFSLDISSVSGASFLETIDVRSITKQGQFYLTFGPHIFIPSQWENTTGFNFLINNSTSNSFFINSYKLMFKSYFM